MFVKPEKNLVEHPEVVFPVDDWDVPMLNIEMQPLRVEKPWDAWGTLKKNYQYKTIHFYQWDYRFDYLVRSPEKVIFKNPKAVVETNFSTNIDSPSAYLLGMIYSKRWLSRLWQSFGIEIWVDANFPPELKEIQFLGVPYGWKAYATRAFTENPEVNIAQWEMCCERAGSKNILFVVVAGGKRFQEMCKKKGWVWIPSIHEKIQAELELEINQVN